MAYSNLKSFLLFYSAFAQFCLRSVFTMNAFSVAFSGLQKKKICLSAAFRTKIDKNLSSKTH